MLNKKVIHKTLGEGVIVKFEDNIVTAEISGKMMKFRYPDIFAQFLTFADEEAQNEVKTLADAAVAKKDAENRAKEEAKADEIRRHYARIIAEENKKRKISTAKLNEFFLPLIENYPPPAYKGKYIKIKYVSQLPDTQVPTFVFFANLPQYIKQPYMRFLENKLRETWEFHGTPILLFPRQK